MKMQLLRSQKLSTSPKTPNNYLLGRTLSLEVMMIGDPGERLTHSESSTGLCLVVGGLTGSGGQVGAGHQVVAHQRVAQHQSGLGLGEDKN